MKTRTASGVMLTLLLTSMLMLAFKIHPVKAIGTIYIRADGSVDPPTAPIWSVDNVTYTFTVDINESIVVEKDNIVVDGAGYTLQGTGSGIGIDLVEGSNVTIKNMEIKAFDYGIRLFTSSNNSISGNKITNNLRGILLNDTSNNNSVLGNKITNNEYGIELRSSSDSNSISGNKITTNNWYGIYFFGSSYNSVSGNKITNNLRGIKLEYSSSNGISANNIMANNEYGIYFRYSYRSSVSGNNITANGDSGLMLKFCSVYNSISGNDIVANGGYGVELRSSSDSNSVSGNNIVANGDGIYIYDCFNITISGNNITNNGYGIEFDLASNNSIYHNNFINNTVQVYTENSVNIWDSGYPSCGNYWSNYAGKDKNGDGIGDTHYVIDEDNQDNYPLMSPWSPSWSPKTPVPFWMQWWFWTIVIAGIAVLAGVSYFLKKRKPQTPTVPPLPSEGTV